MGGETQQIAREEQATRRRGRGNPKGILLSKHPKQMPHPEGAVYTRSSQRRPSHRSVRLGPHGVSNSGHVDCGNQILVDETNEDMTTRCHTLGSPKAAQADDKETCSRHASGPTARRERENKKPTFTQMERIAMSLQRQLASGRWQANARRAPGDSTRGTQIPPTCAAPPRAAAEHPAG